MDGEQRGGNRFKARLTVVYTELKTAETRRALTDDLSAKGMRLITDRLLSLGTPLEVSLTLPDRDKPLKLQAEVVWSKAIEGLEIEGMQKNDEATTVHTAIQFLHLSREEQVLIKYYASVYGLP